MNTATEQNAPAPQKSTLAATLRNRAARNVALAYMLVAGIWILFSDMFLQALHLSPETLTFWQTIKGWLFVFTTGGLLFLYLKHCLKKAQATEETFLHLYESLAGTTGQDYFETLAKRLTSIFNVDGCLIGDGTGNSESLHILACAPASLLKERGSYPLQGTPCRDVLKRGASLHLHQNARTSYPQADCLKETGGNSYLGLPLLDDSGQSIGLLALLDSSEIPQSTLTLKLLDACAARAANELQRIHSERKLREQFEQFTALFESLNAVIYVADMQTYEILYANKFSEESFGKDWQGQTCHRYLQGLESPCGFCTNPSLIKDGVPTPPIIWEFCNTLNKRWFQCIDKAIRWPDGRLVRLEIALDITEHKELEQVKNDLLSTVSHEMRTPLTAVTGFAELLLEDAEIAGQSRNYLETIFKEAEKLGDLINTFIDVRRFKTDRTRVDYERAEVQSLFKASTVSLRDCAEHHSLKIDCPSGLHVYGNRKELTQLIAQLTSNACRYSPDGGPITLLARQDGEYVRLQIIDQGIGIPAEQQEKIFEQFHRLDTGDRRRTSGTGLGLTLAREIVHLHGGQIWVESKPGQGSTFSIVLPNAPEKAANPVDQPPHE
jgi:GAF domain-containing protein